MFYLIETEYVGPNKKDSHGGWIGDSRVLHICKTPGKTNLSHQELVNGYLGTTNDISRTAHGEYDSIDDARNSAHELGFTVNNDADDDDDDDNIVESWITESGSRDKWDAGDWFINGLGSHGTIKLFGITAKTTDDELWDISEDAYQKAIDDDNVELFGILELLTELRDDLIDDDEED